MAVVLGLLVAAGFGSADFFGGRASERASTIAVLLVAQVVAVGGALLVSFVASARVTSADLGYGGAAGAVSVAGLGFLYRGLAAGRVSVVAPLTAVVGALVPVAWALLSGERPSAVVLIGAGCATVAGGLIAREQHAVGDTDAAFNGVLYALAAGALLGSSLVLFAETGAGSGLIPVLAARLVGLALVVAVFVAVAARSRVVVPARSGTTARRRCGHARHHFDRLAVARRAAGSRRGGRAGCCAGSGVHRDVGVADRARASERRSGRGAGPRARRPRARRVRLTRQSVAPGRLRRWTTQPSGGGPARSRPRSSR